MTKLEYLMIYTQARLPIYSKCYGAYCKTAFRNPELLSGLLSAIETIPPTLSDGLSLESVKMGGTEMRFQKTTPSSHSIVIGLSEEDQPVADEVFKAVSIFLESEKFRDVDWNFIEAETMQDFQNDLLENVLPEALHDYGGFSDDCPLGNQCPLHTTARESKLKRIWGTVKEKYAALRQKMMGT